MHLRLTVQDVGRTRAVFEKVLGWRVERFVMPHEYYRVQAGPDHKRGLDGGGDATKEAPLREGRPMTRIASLSRTASRPWLLRNRRCGRLVEATAPIAGVSWNVTCAGPRGLKFGLIQVAPSVDQRGDVSNFA